MPTGRTTARSDEDENGHGRSSWTPRPDPTKLTTEQLNREIGSLDKVITTRLDGMDRAIILFNENLTRVPTDTDKQVQGLKGLLEERLRGMDKAQSLLQTIFDHLPELVDDRIEALKSLHSEMFASIQTRFLEQKVDSKVAVDAALQAQKEAASQQNVSFALSINKSESAFKEQMVQLQTLIAQQGKNSADKIDDIKQRVTAMESSKQATSEGVVTQNATEYTKHNSNALVIAVVGAVFACVGSVLGILGFALAVMVYLRH